MTNILLQLLTLLLTVNPLTLCATLLDDNCRKEITCIYKMTLDLIVLKVVRLNMEVSHTISSSSVVYFFILIL